MDGRTEKTIVDKIEVEPSVPLLFFDDGDGVVRRWVRVPDRVGVSVSVGVGVSVSGYVWAEGWMCLDRGHLDRGYLLSYLG